MLGYLSYALVWHVGSSFHRGTVVFGVPMEDYPCSLNLEGDSLGSSFSSFIETILGMVISCSVVVQFLIWD